MHKDVNIPHGLPKSYEFVVQSTRYEAYFRLQSNIVYPFYFNTTQELYITHILDQEESGLANTIDPYKLFDDTLTTTRVKTYLFLPKDEFTTTDLVEEQFKQKFIQSKQERKILERLAVIAQREDNWDGYDSKKPSKLTISRAEHFIKELLDNDTISARLLQLKPFICSDEDGYITIECYKGNRSLCFDIQEDETKYTKIEKTSANTMTQTDSLNQDNYLPLLEWFLDEKIRLYTKR